MRDQFPFDAGTLRQHFVTLYGGADSPIRRRSYAAGETIYRPGDPAASLAMIESGRVRVFVESIEGQGHPQVKRKSLHYVETNGFFGEMALSGQRERTEYAQADRPTTILEMPITDVQNLISANPVIAREIIGLLALHLSEARAEIAGLVFDPVRERVLRRLLQLVEQRSSAEQLTHNDMVVLDITHAQLAMSVGAARETVSTDVEELKSEDVLRIRRGRLEIFPDRLRKALAAELAKRTTDVSQLRRLTEAAPTGLSGLGLPNGKAAASLTRLPSALASNR